MTEVYILAYQDKDLDRRWVRRETEFPTLPELVEEMHGVQIRDAVYERDFDREWEILFRVETPVENAAELIAQGQAAADALRVERDAKHQKLVEASEREALAFLKAKYEGKEPASCT